jgi:starch synthase
LFDRDRIHRLGIPEPAFHMNGVEFYEKLSFMKAGLFYSSFVTTVSASYAQEITTPEAGCGLDGLLRMRASQGRLAGILNGIDERWDPRNDPGLYQNFAAGDWRLRKRNTEAIRQTLGLAVSRGPLFAVVSRLVEQKGIDLVIDAADAIVAAGGQIIINGTGDRQIERRVEALSDRHPGQIAARISFDETEAKNLFAGSDFLLMPSRFEPCGLSQMYAQRFGSLPVARKIGGLADTIRDGVTGILFSETTVGCFAAAIATAFRTFASKQRLNAMRAAAMARPAGWDEPCNQYELVYARTIGNR